MNEFGKNLMFSLVLIVAMIGLQMFVLSPLGQSLYPALNSTMSTDSEAQSYIELIHINGAYFPTYVAFAVAIYIGIIAFRREDVVDQYYR